MLKKYQSFEEKRKILDHKVINGLPGYLVVNELKLLDYVLNVLQQGQFIYRGINNASFKCYSSAQRNWLCKTQFWEQIDLDNSEYKYYFDWLICHLDRKSQLKEGMLSDYHLALRIMIDKAKYNQKFRKYFDDRGVNLTDFFVMAVMQHFPNFSPLLDFSTDINKALFFTTDNYEKSNGETELDDYVSLYYIDRTIDWVQSDLQIVNVKGAENAEILLKDAERKGIPVDTKDYRFSTINLPFEDYLGSPDFLVVNGPEGGIVEVKLPSQGFSCTYDMHNPRIDFQKGLFIFNYSDSEPLWEVINNGRDSTRNFIRCIDIHKDLVPHIQKTRLEPNNINKETMYYPTEDSRELESIMKEIYQY